MRISAALSVVVLLGACDHRIPLGSLVVEEDTGSNGMDSDGAAPNDGGSDAATDAGSEDVCERKGPLVDVGDGAGDGCPSGVDTRAFRFGVCTCASFESRSTTIVDAFDSRDGPFTSGVSGGALGANESVFPNQLQVSGDLVAAGANGIPLKADIEVGGDILDQGQLDGTTHGVQVAGDARIGGNLHVARITVGGSLTVDEASDVAVTDGAPPFTRKSVIVAPPCDCEPELDVQALIAAAASSNDNLTIDLDPSEGLRSLQGPIERTLPCGTYYVDAFYAPQPITLTITGHVALFVNSNIVAEQQGDVRFVLAPGGELDLFIANGISTTRLFELGNAESAGRIRLYTDSDSSLYFSGETTIAGSVYGPRAGLTSEGPFTVFGAVHVRQVSAGAPFTVHYDRSLASETCRL